MPNEEKIEAPVQVAQPETNIAPGFEEEFNDAFAKSLSGFKVAEKVDPIKEPDSPKQDEKSPTGSNPDEKKKKQVDDAPLPDPESLDQAPPTKGSAQAKDGWNSLRNNYKKAHRITHERDETIKKLEAALAEKGMVAQKESGELRAQIEELSRYRAMVDIQADPDFVSKYDQPIEKAEASVREILTDLNVAPEIIDKIDFTNTKLMDEIVGHVSEHQDKFVAKKIQRKIEDLLDLHEKRNETLQEHKKNYKEHLESKKKESFSRDAESEGRALQHLESIAASKDKEGNVIFPFLNKIEPKQGADQAEIDRTNGHNKMVELMTGRVNEVLKMKTPEQRSEVAVAAVAAHYLSAQLRAATTKIKSLEEELKKISTVTTESIGSKPTMRRNGSGELVSHEEAINAHFGR